MSTGAWAVSVVFFAGVVLIATIIGLQISRLRSFERSNIRDRYRQRWGTTYDQLVDSLGRRRTRRAIHEDEIGQIPRQPSTARPGELNAPEDRS